jgi:hypothetical protein
MKVIRPVAVEPGAGQTKIEEGARCVRFALRSQHSSRGPGRRVARIAAIQNEHGFALNGKVSGNGESDYSSANNDDVVQDGQAVILHDPERLSFVLR